MVLDNEGDYSKPPKARGLEYVLFRSRRVGAYLVYWLLLFSFLMLIPGVIGLVIAYVNKDDAPGWLRSHYIFQIHTFWKGLALAIAGTATVWLFGLGYLILMCDAAWMAVRIMRGLFWLSKHYAVPRPRNWLLGD